MKAYLVAAIVAGTFSRPSHAGAQDADLTAARDLYASAAYDDALSVLNRLRSSEHPASQSRAIEQYRAFCLLALGRPADAEQAIEAVVAAEPTYTPGDGDASPRIRSAFTAVRRRMLPSIIQQKYAQAKAAFDRKDFWRRRRRLHAGAERAGRPGRRDRSQASASVGSADAGGRFPGARGEGGRSTARAAGTGRCRHAASAAAGTGAASHLHGRRNGHHGASSHQPGAAALSQARW
jgi:hypothetical protein